MTTFHPWEGGKVVSFTKGAIEAVAERSDRVLTAAGTQDMKAAGIMEESERISAEGLRTLGFAMRLWDRYKHANDLQALNILLAYNRDDVLNLPLLEKRLFP